MDVLIVDDSAAIRKILQRVLRQADVPLGLVHEAGDGAEALNTLKTAKVDLILSDINMPNMDGLELLGKAARRRCSKRCNSAPPAMYASPSRRTRLKTSSSACSSQTREDETLREDTWTKY